MPILKWLKKELEIQLPLVRYEFYRAGAIVVLALIPSWWVYFTSRISRFPLLSPIGVFLILLVLLFWFSRGLARTAQTTQKQEQTPTQEQASLVAKSEYADADQFYKTYDNALLVETEGYLLSVVKNYQPGEARERVLIRMFSSEFWRLNFENYWALILASQMKLLHAINESSGGLTVEEAMPFYVSAATNFPEVYQNFAFGDWLNWLTIATVLLRQEGRILNITIRGKEYLKYVLICGYSLKYKAG